MTDPESKPNRRNVLKAGSATVLGAVGLVAGTGIVAAAECGCGFSEGDSLTLDSSLGVYDTCDLSQRRGTWDAGETVYVADCEACYGDDFALHNSTRGEYGFVDCGSLESAV